MLKLLSLYSATGIGGGRTHKGGNGEEVFRCFRHLWLGRETSSACVTNVYCCQAYWLLQSSASLHISMFLCASVEMKTPSTDCHCCSCCRSTLEVVPCSRGCNIRCRCHWTCWDTVSRKHWLVWHICTVTLSSMKISG